MNGLTVDLSALRKTSANNWNTIKTISRHKKWGGARHMGEPRDHKSGGLEPLGPIGVYAYAYIQVRTVSVAALKQFTWEYKQKWTIGDQTHYLKQFWQIVIRFSTDIYQKTNIFFRQRPHDKALTPITTYLSDRDYIMRMLYKNC